MQSLNINTAKIDKTALFEGKQGKYLNLTLMQNKDGPGQYGDDGFIIQDIGKERRLKGEKGPIIGNWKYIGQGNAERPAQGARSSEFGKAEQQRDNGGGSASDDFDDIPFAPMAVIPGF